MKNLLILIGIIFLSINIFSIEDDPYRKPDFDINNYEHFAKDYYQFDMEEGTDYEALITPQDAKDKARRIQSMISIIDCSLKELDYLIEIEALKTMYLSEAYVVGEDGTCLDENGNACTQSYYDNITFVEKVRALKKKVYKNITSPIEIIILDWIMSQRMEVRIWENLDVEDLGRISDPNERKQAFIDKSIQIWEKVQYDFFDEKTGGFTDAYKEYQNNIEEYVTVYMKEYVDNSEQSDVTLINVEDDEIPVNPTDCSFHCLASGGICNDGNCECEKDQDQDGEVDTMPFDENSDGVDDYCIDYDGNNTSNHCEDTETSMGICNGHGKCVYNNCVCEEGYRLWRGNCVGNFLNFLGDSLSMTAYHENQYDEFGIFFAEDIWPGTKSYPKEERYRVSIKAKKFFDTVKKGDVLSVRGSEHWYDPVLNIFRGFFHHTTLAIKNMKMPDGFIPDPDEKTFISARNQKINGLINEGVVYETRRMYQYVYYGDSFANNANVDGYLYAPNYYIIFAQTPTEFAIEWKIYWKKIKFWCFTVKFPIPYPRFYFKNPGASEKDKAVTYAIKQLGEPYNIFDDYFPFWQYSEDSFYCSSLAWRAWDKVRDTIFFGFDIDGTLNPTVMPIAIFKDWNMDNTRGMMYHKLVEEAFYFSF